MFSTAQSSLDLIRRQVAEMRALADSADGQLFAESRLSGWTPAEHLDHVTKVAASVVNRLLQHDAERVNAPLSFIGRVVLILGRFPRGRGRSPERLRGARLTAPELHAGLTKLEGKLDQLEQAHLAETRGAVVPHPRFGGLRPGQALRFVAIHNDHHLRIIADILR